jgi:hypothetical protein
MTMRFDYCRLGCVFDPDGLGWCAPSSAARNFVDVAAWGPHSPSRSGNLARLKSHGFSIPRPRSVGFGERDGDSARIVLVSA